MAVTVRKPENELNFGSFLQVGNEFEIFRKKNKCSWRKVEMLQNDLHSTSDD